MIKLRRLNESQIVINTDLIEFIESTPDTVLTLTTGQKLIVADSIDEVIDKVVEFRKRSFPFVRIVQPERVTIEKDQPGAVEESPSCLADSC
jgi:flagellar protein FlbD